MQKLFYLVILVFTAEMAIAKTYSTNQNSNTMQNTENKIATFGTGCFWCSEAIFDQLNGVVEVKPGYSGGTVKNPTYKDVCTGETGHAEVIRIEYNPDVISYKELLEVFWKTHDPTTLNRQGADVGTQYRSVIFYYDSDQEKEARAYKKALEEAEIWSNPIVTEISPATAFYYAEDYHNDYYANNPANGYCNFVITPKIEKFKKVFLEKLKPEL